MPKKQDINENQDLMKTNVGIIDRAIRFVITFIIVGLYIANVISGTFGIVLLVLAAVLFVTAFLRFCPLYAPFGMNTWNKK